MTDAVEASLVTVYTLEEPTNSTASGSAACSKVESSMVRGVGHVVTSSVVVPATKYALAIETQGMSDQPHVEISAPVGETDSAEREGLLTGGKRKWRTDAF